MNYEIFNNLVKIIKEELDKEHDDVEVKVDNCVFMQPWNKFAVSLNDLGYNPEDYEGKHGKDLNELIMQRIVNELEKLETINWCSFTYEVPEGKPDNRHYLYKMLDREGNKDHYNIVIRLN